MKIIIVNEDYQTGYQYSLAAPVGEKYSPEFKPQLTPPLMLKLGIFGGAYFTKQPSEFPPEWFKGIIFSKSSKSEKELNYYMVNASQPLETWQKKGWIYFEDPLGWFLWYCRYYIGRRIPKEDLRQIKRWKNMKRHVAQLQGDCIQGDISCRPRQRQALLHWAYDSRLI
jgi:hypothetical protein